MKKLITTLLILLMVACAGKRFSFENARKLHEGMTEQEVTKLMGAPRQKIAQGDQQTWAWGYSNGITGNYRSMTVIFTNGVVSSVPTIPDSFR